MKNNNLKYISLKLLILFFMTSCNQDESPLKVGIRPPSINGIYITDNMSNTIGVWGIVRKHYPTAGRKRYNCYPDTLPSDSSFVRPLWASLELPYPSPNDGCFSMDFSVPCTSYVRMSLVKGVFGTNVSNQTVNSGGANFYTGSDMQIKTLINGDVVPPGRRRYIMCDRIDDSGKELTTGFYRIYLEVEDELFYQDTFIWRDWNDIPKSLREIIERM